MEYPLDLTKSGKCLNAAELIPSVYFNKMTLVVIAVGTVAVRASAVPPPTGLLLQPVDPCGRDLFYCPPALFLSTNVIYP